MTNTFPCPHCRTAVAQGTTRCWLCAGPLDPRFVPQGTAISQDKTWLIVVILASLVLLLIGAQLALIAPGLLVIYAVVALPIAVTLARIAWVGRLDFWRSTAASAQAMVAPPRGASAHTAPAAAPGGRPYPAPLEAAPGLRGVDSGINDDAAAGTATTILTGLAFGVALFLGILALLVVLFMAAVVVFAIVCFASLP